MKLIVGVMSGSVSIVSEAIHSTMDLIAAVIAYFSVRISDNPPDEDHPYGHGKFENVSGVIEAFLILIAAFWIIYEAIHKFIKPGEVDSTSIGIGAAVMFFSAAINFMVSRKLYKVAKETESIALEADALHLKTDVYTSVGVGLGLTLIWLTGYTILDPIVAILVALFILKESFNLLSRAYSPLLDTALPQAEINKIKQLLNDMNIRYHELKTRKAGSHKFVDLHIEMPAKMELGEVHKVCDDIENKLNNNIPQLRVNIHVEPID
jgi:cation diffusion facilitator family transporter